MTYHRVEALVVDGKNVIPRLVSLKKLHKISACKYDSKLGTQAYLGYLLYLFRLWSTRAIILTIADENKCLSTKVVSRSQCSHSHIFCIFDPGEKKLASITI